MDMESHTYLHTTATHMFAIRQPDPPSLPRHRSYSSEREKHTLHLHHLRRLFPDLQMRRGVEKLPISIWLKVSTSIHTISRMAR